MATVHRHLILTTLQEITGKVFCTVDNCPCFSRSTSLPCISSWFAGNMDETEAANLLVDQPPGHFLIRISSSRACEGVFVLAVNTSDNGVVQIRIEVS